MKTLKLFNAVLAKETKVIEPSVKLGYIIEPSALWAEKQITSYYKKEALSGNDLNKTFHKSWKKIKDSSRYELLVEQIRHYISTYGSNFQDEIYIPEEVLKIPKMKLVFKVIKGLSKEEMIEKCLFLLQSGIALKEETINDVLTILVDEMGYKFTGDENIRNKEAIIKIADIYGILPKDTMEFFRYIIYRATGNSLLIKNKEMVIKIKETNFNPAPQMSKFGLRKLSEIFNRFKPLFLAFKKQCPKTINAISRLSKINHRPMVQNPLNFVTSQWLKKEDTHWIDNATPYAIFKAMAALYVRNYQDSFVYRIRNGKSYTKENKKTYNCIEYNFQFLSLYLKEHFDFSGKKVFIPKDIEYALPTSEKMFVGNIPTGTRFFGKKLAVGIYWENDWGAHDLDLSGINIGGKIGWNSKYNQNSGSLMYSGDITSAPSGAVEYLYAAKKLAHPTIVQNNIYRGSTDCKYKIIIGKGDKVSKKYMMNPNNLFAEISCEAIQKQMILGIVIPQKEQQCFVLLNFGSGNCNISSTSRLSYIAIKALFQQWNEPLSFNKLIDIIEVEVVNDKDEADFDFSMENLTKDSFIEMFKE